MNPLRLAAAALAVAASASAQAPAPPREAAPGTRVSRVEYAPAKHPYCFLVDGDDMGSDASRAVDAVKAKGVRHVRFWSRRKDMPLSECKLYSLFSRADITILEFRVVRAFIAHPDLTRSWWPPCGESPAPKTPKP